MRHLPPLLKCLSMAIEFQGKLKVEQIYQLVQESYLPLALKMKQELSALVIILIAMQVMEIKYSIRRVVV